MPICMFTSYRPLVLPASGGHCFVQFQMELQGDNWLPPLSWRLTPCNACLATTRESFTTATATPGNRISRWLHYAIDYLDLLVLILFDRLVSFTVTDWSDICEFWYDCSQGYLIFTDPQWSMLCRKIWIFKRVQILKFWYGQTKMKLQDREQSGVWTVKG